MKHYEINGKQYRLPNSLTDFQRQIYVHLIDWKWTNLGSEPGFFKNQPYDAILSEECVKQGHPLYQPIFNRFKEHQLKFPFKSHKFLGHMASSQAACANLFLPLLEDPQIGSLVLRSVKTDLSHIATDHLDRGFRIEFWDEPYNILNDHTKVSGTDADIAIAYYDFQGDLNLWMIEHKLTETEFTTCGGAKSQNRTCRHTCSPASAILEDKTLCYYHSGCGYRYWDITLKNPWLFYIEHIRTYHDCPFKGGMNQLWRNLVLAISLEDSRSQKYPYKKVYFSVVHHPKNNLLQPSINEFSKVIGYNDRFFAFSSDRLINQAIAINEPALTDWIRWYSALYFF